MADRKRPPSGEIMNFIIFFKIYLDSVSKYLSNKPKIVRLLKRYLMARFAH